MPPQKSQKTSWLEAMQQRLNGDMPQKLREKTVDRLRKGHVKIVVATDVATRELDVDVITHVVNYDAPFDLESYTHRIGRTGRPAGKETPFFLSPTKRCECSRQSSEHLKCHAKSMPSRLRKK